MNNYWSLYLLTRLDSLIGLSIGVAVILFVAVLILGVTAIMHYIEDDCEENIDERKLFRSKLIKSLKWCISVGVFFTLISALVPSRNEAIFIVAGGKTMDFIQNDTTINKIPAQTTILISEFLEKQINEVKASGSVTSK